MIRSKIWIRLPACRHVLASPCIHGAGSTSRAHRYAKAIRQVSYGTPVPAHPASHGELFQIARPEHLRSWHVPYRGTGPVIADLVSGQVPMGVPGVTGQVIEFHRTGKMRVLP